MKASIFRLLGLGSLTLALILFFQNCSSQMSLTDEKSISVDDLLLSSPQVTFATQNDLISSSSYEASFDVIGNFTSATCQLNSGVAQDCTSRSVTYTNLADGDYTLLVTITTSTGVTSQGTKTFRKDSTIPTVMVSMTPAISTTQTTATFVFMALDNLSGVARIECSLNNAVFTTCTSPQNLSNINIGNHNFRIRAVDRANNQSLLYSYAWSVTASPVTTPTVILTPISASLTNLTNMSFTFSGTNAVSFQCQIDGAAFAACASPQSYSNLRAGNHSFSVRAVGADGSFSTASQATWMIDLVAPALPTIMANVQAVSNVRTATMSFSATDSSGISQYQCSLNNAAFAACTSPQSLSNLVDGNQNFRVQARDNAGNISPIASFSWNVTISQPPVQGEGPGRVPVFVAVGKGARTMMSCDGGQTWIREQADFPNIDCGTTDCDHHAGSPTGLSYQQGYFYATFGWGSARSMKRSTDGYNWTVIGSKPQVGAGGGLAIFPTSQLWVNGGEYELSSNLGQTWSNISNIVSFNLARNVTSSGTMAVVTSDETSVGKVTYDSGQTWSNFSIAGVNFAGRNFQIMSGNNVIIGLSTLYTYSQQTGGASTVNISISRDGGRTWIGRTVQTGTEYVVWSQLIFDGTRFMAWLGNRLWTSTDGENWQQQMINIDMTFAAARSPAGAFVATPNVFGPQYAYRSTDGITWTRLSAAAFRSGPPIVRIISGFVDASVCP